ncbi:RhoGEF domain protein [Necator americanus]|uniref:RhoGEF domain protein n=1 Tax=Necator americanus TaxID=51031 RepID=W2TA81_NECAM|nr:RhoGEF domain protein [Necator americanus]ETN77907.1 RhoGEF domain protein [Necator americanus]
MYIYLNDGETRHNLTFTIPFMIDPARLSFVSSSTGYSSARSSLRSSDGGEDNSNNRDSGIVSLSSLSSLSSSRRSTLLSAGSLSHVDRIAIELFDTEKSYVEDLYAVIQGYLNFLVDHRDELGVTLDNISSLFGCIERIYAFNRKLLQQLDLADLDCVKMSRCFVDSAGKFEDYIVYCTNYHRMIATLSQLQQQPHLAAALSQRQAALGHALPLSAYLLKPVQRVLKYHLFIEQTANLSAYGELLLEAQFRQAGSKTTRLLFLFEEMLLIVKQRNSNYVCKDYIMSSNLMLNESIYPEEPLAFQVLSFDNPRTQYIFLASSADQKRTWMIELKRMMLDHYGIEIPEKTKQLMLSMDNTQRVAFGRPEFAEVSLKNHKRVPKYLEKRRKSVDKGTSDQNRRRSLSASRLLGASKTSLVSDSSRYKLFGVPDVVPKCTCHMSTTPGPSNGPVSNRVSAVSKVPVSRTLSASTIFFDGSLEGAQSAPAKEAVLSSRSRYHMARNKKALPPKCETRSPSIRRIECEEIDETFNELFKELVSCGNASPKTQARQAVAVAPNSSEQDSLQEVMAYREQAVYKNRSKSLTRLDEFCDPSIDLLLNGDVAESFTPSELYEQERHFNRGDQMKRGRAKKYHMSGDSEMLRGGCGRIPLSDRAATIAEVDSPRGDFPLIDDDVVSPRKLAARQRTPLTVEQAAELDALIPVGGVVKTLIRQIESTGS